MTFKGPEQVKAVGRKIDGAELVESSAIAARYQNGTTGGDVIGLKLPGRASRIIYRAARPRPDKRARNALNRVSPEFEAGPGD